MVAENILKNAELPHYKPDGNTSVGAMQSISFYRLHASKDPERTKKLAAACVSFTQ
jgi:hypothetical protein